MPQQRNARPTTHAMAELVLPYVRDDIRYVSNEDCWYTFDGRMWVAGGKILAETKVMQACLAVLQQAPDPDNAITMTDLSRHLLMDSTQQSILRYLSKLEPVLVPNGDEMFDGPATAELVNFLNGVLCLRTGTLTPHGPQHKRLMMTMCSTFALAPLDSVFAVPLEELRAALGEGPCALTHWDDIEARAPKIGALLYYLFEGDIERLEFFLRMAGRALIGKAQNRWLHIYGAGGNGKSTLHNLIMAMAGTYGTAIRDDVVYVDAKPSHSTELSVLRGKRCMFLTDMKSKRVVDSSLITTLSGGSPINARDIGQSAKRGQFTVRVMPITVSNHALRLDVAEDAVARRFRQMTMSRLIKDWRGGPPMTEEADRVLASEEGPVFAALCMEAARRWLADQREAFPECWVEITEEAMDEARPDDPVLTVLAGILEPVEFRVPSPQHIDNRLDGMWLSDLLPLVNEDIVQMGGKHTRPQSLKRSVREFTGHYRRTAPPEARPPEIVFVKSRSRETYDRVWICGWRESAAHREARQDRRQQAF